MTTRSALAAIALLLLAGCAVRAPVPAPTQAAPPPREQSLERDYRSRAAALMREQRWAEAQVQWELLLLLRPGAGEYRNQLESTRKHIAETALSANALAATARKRGDLETATTQYLRALAADHDNAVAVHGLRDIERERTRRAYLNRPPRNLLGVIMGRPGAPVETESDVAQRQKSGNGGENGAPRRE